MEFTREGKDMVVSESSRNLEVIVNDTFQLACAAAKFYYSSVNLTFSGGQGQFHFISKLRLFHSASNFVKHL